MSEYLETFDIRIRCLSELKMLVGMKRSVVCPRHPAWKDPRPAAVVINLPGEVLLGMFKRGMYLYQKSEKSDV